MKLFGRDPALILAFVAATVQGFSAFVLNVSPELQGAINAVAIAMLGFLTARSIARDKLVPAVLGLAQAVLALVLAFGWHATGDQQATIMAFVATAVAMFVRTQVTAPVGPDGQKVV